VGGEAFELYDGFRRHEGDIIRLIGVRDPKSNGKSDCESFIRSVVRDPSNETGVGRWRGSRGTKHHV
jgi:hypothetical protein